MADNFVFNFFAKCAHMFTSLYSSNFDEYVPTSGKKKKGGQSYSIPV